MLIHYIRTPRKYTARVVRNADGTIGSEVVVKGDNPYGIIVATERNRVGYAVCAPGDFYKKEKGLQIALNRADHFGTDKEAILASAPTSIRKELLDMYARSERYFK